MPSFILDMQRVAMQGVFTELIHEFGVKDVQVQCSPSTASRLAYWTFDTSIVTFTASKLQVEELYSLEEEALQDLRCVAVCMQLLCTVDRQCRPQHLTLVMVRHAVRCMVSSSYSSGSLAGMKPASPQMMVAAECFSPHKSSAMHAQHRWLAFCYVLSRTAIPPAAVHEACSKLSLSQQAVHCRPFWPCCSTDQTWRLVQSSDLSKISPATSLLTCEVLPLSLLDTAMTDALWPRESTAECLNDVSLSGEAIGNSESIRRAHNSFAPPEPIVSDESRATEKDGQLTAACPMCTSSM